jgi:hypothetical protein
MMAQIIIDLTGDEWHWNGEIDVKLANEDSLTGCNMALCFGDHELVLTTTQAITLFDILDVWLNAGPIREIGAVERRIHDGIAELVKDRATLKKMFSQFYTEENFVRELIDYLKMAGLRFRMTGDEPLMSREPKRKSAPQRLPSNGTPVGSVPASSVDEAPAQETK